MVPKVIRQKIARYRDLDFAIRDLALRIVTESDLTLKEEMTVELRKLQAQQKAVGL
jgi:hypothetical protein